MKKLDISLADGWKLGADNLQWILYRERMSKGRKAWRGVSFVRSNKAVLMRVLKEEGVRPTPEASAALRQLPETFDEWKIDG